MYLLLVHIRIWYINTGCEHHSTSCTYIQNIQYIRTYVHYTQYTQYIQYMHIRFLIACWALYENTFLG